MPFREGTVPEGGCPSFAGEHGELLYSNPGRPAIP